MNSCPCGADHSDIAKDTRQAFLDAIARYTEHHRAAWWSGWAWGFATGVLAWALFVGLWIVRHA